MLDDLNMYVYPPAPHTDKTPEEILDSIFDKHFSSSDDDLEATNGGLHLRCNRSCISRCRGLTFDFTVEHAQNTYYNLPPHLNKYASSAKPIIIDQKYKVDFNPKATTSHILNNLGMFVLMVVNGGFHLFPLCGKWKGSNVSKADMKALCLRQQVHTRRTTLPTSSTQRWMKETRLVTSRSAGHAPFRRHSR